MLGVCETGNRLNHRIAVLERETSLELVFYENCGYSGQREGLNGSPDEVRLRLWGGDSDDQLSLCATLLMYDSIYGSYFSVSSKK